MAQYWLDMDRSEAELQAEWSFGDSQLAKVTVSGVPAIRLTPTTTSNFSSAVWGVPGTGVSPREIYCKSRMESSANTRYAGPGSCDINGSDPRGIFGAARVGGANNFTLIRRGTSTVQEQNITDGPDNTALYCQRIYVETDSSNNPTMRWKVWAPSDAEPETFRFNSTISVNDVYAQEASVGAGVLFRNISGLLLEITEFGVGTDNDPAPTGPVGGISAEPFLLRHNPRTNKVIPVLSSPTVTDIGAACVRPRVTKGY